MLKILFFQFFLIDEPQPSARDPVLSVAVGVTDMERSVEYWAGLLGLGVVGAGRSCTALSYCPASQASLVLEAQPTVDHATAAGRIAFCVPAAQLPDLQVDHALVAAGLVVCIV